METLLVEMGTFVAILVGTLAGSLLISIEDRGPTILAGCVVIVSVFGFLTSQRIPVTPRGAPDLKVSYNPFTPTYETYKKARSNRPVFLSILGISWFWFLGASLLTLLPTYCRDYLLGDESVASYFLVLFCIGIGTGSMLCERLSHGSLELGLVPLGSIGMTVFAFDLFLAGVPVVSETVGSGIIGLGEFLTRSGSIPDQLRLFVHRGVQRVLYRTALHHDSGKERTRTPISDHCGQQHPERAVHGGVLIDAFDPFRARGPYPHRFLGLGCTERRSGLVHLYRHSRVLTSLRNLDDRQRTVSNEGRGPDVFTG